MKTFIKWLVIIFIALLVIGLVFGDNSKEEPNNKVDTTTVTANQAVGATPTNQDMEQPESINQTAEPETPSMTGPQKNAVRSAEQYLSFTGFSREGLIQQLSSSYGDGYEVADATVAVDSLNVDWNEQAVKSAKQYLDMSGFSCDGLIEQLSSSAGDKYTQSQATYGAQQAGACS
ncbi:Ltp family lipoprotein [Acinetobacter lwoffii]|uniref:Putative host cell surface-exposed lipoprotein Ltp-like HTH region domain-containing protein n=1 Tax=Acinetobacter lwoffii NCTC 5866 = CIP 64.10 = NIPH 512 TaxID=981327 RepID=A0ABN0PYN3_ACILW|nr:MULTISPECIES: Ltp family lipoprotein [Acinetobacter]ENU16247.1 hypothetical protein F995_01723 [Acinetobacter sp. CIP A162]ESJ95605.1 hypothetical protein P800_00419 [Acinetobacter lwoffii NCTC 5866 = CIP 64.10 = NIPH 512]MCU4521165.1 Ltp family lipoprotein [Acinetobacter schindleri]QXB40846.1 Ltp family lipoprotein [Acinetobacter lwoffii]TMS51120.1 hypothetical protein FGQ54_06960 [Acinetobacter lwoffii]